MKKFNLVLTVAFFMFATFAIAQNTTTKWLLGVGIHATDHTSAGDKVFDGYFDVKDYSLVPPLSKLTISRLLGKNFAIDAQASVGNIDNKRFGIKDEFFILAGGGFRFMPLSETSWFDPYLRVGANYHKYKYKSLNISEQSPQLTYDHDYDETETKSVNKEFVGHDNNFIANGGVGINFWFAKRFGINIESQYNWAPFTGYKTNYIDFFQHSASLIFRFGQSDRDKDGVPDKDDRCPDVPGLKEFQGCPDTDGDGIPDDQDECPNEAGPIENNGCPWPDRDGDGVLDKDDRCPDVPGLVEFQGCPDTDGDGIPDDQDRCPELAGLAEFQGCPDTDGDGIPDDLDECPNEAGPKSNNGCPITETTVSKKIVNILFKFNSSELTPESLPMVKEAADLLNDSTMSGKKFYVDGHTDRKGSNAVNNRISKQRAQTVVNELVKNGVSRDRLQARGFGKTQFLCKEQDINSAKDKDGKILFSNQEQCDLANRRVVFRDMNETKVSVINEKQIKSATK